jgi:ABC-type Fe3+-hydroxamate transport system substrate-binding protein
MNVETLNSMPESKTKNITDQLGRIVTVPNQPKRIVSLVPSQTELLYDLGLSEEVVGQTLFCIHPQEMRKVKPVVGGTKNVKLDRVDALQPDLIIANKEENDKAQIEALMEKYPVWISDIKNLDDALDMVSKVGQLVNRANEAGAITTNIKNAFDNFKRSASNVIAGRRVLYLIWRKPWMCAGVDNFINEMLSSMGLENATTDKMGRYPELTSNDIANLCPDFIFLSSEPYPFKEKHIDELHTICPTSKIILVDGELFSWYGSRLQHSVAYFNKLIVQLSNDTIA